MKDLRISKISPENTALDDMTNNSISYDQKNKERTTKQEIMLYLKKNGKSDLQSISEALNITKMGVHKHITALEEIGYIERESKKASKGRPKVLFKLTESTRDHIFPNNYSELTNYFLNYIEENYGTRAVERALQDRNKEINIRYKKELRGDSLQERVHNLRALRDKEGYMAEQNKVSEESYEILEYNCPIFRIAEKYGFTCNLEREMFEELLNANVDSTHRVVDGQNVCRFLISKHNLRQ